MIISIDLWGTLIKGSPIFEKEKVKLVNDYFNFDEEPEFILKCFKDTKDELNAIIESTGWQPDENLIFSLLFSKLTRTTGHSWKKDYIETFMNRYQHLAHRYPPTIYSPDTENYLSLLSRKAKLIASSNTMFLKGITMQLILQKIGIWEYFQSALFSDEVGASKPSKDMFMVSKELNISTDYHIGDNIYTDGASSDFGSEPIIIHSNNKTLADAYDIIIQK
jgi:FMN phosphatase YigB (HAD superfamily)